MKITINKENKFLKLKRRNNLEYRSEYKSLIMQANSLKMSSQNFGIGRESALHLLIDLKMEIQDNYKVVK